MSRDRANRHQDWGGYDYGGRESPRWYSTGKGLTHCDFTGQQLGRVACDDRGEAWVWDMVIKQVVGSRITTRIRD